MIVTSSGNTEEWRTVYFQTKEAKTFKQIFKSVDTKLYNAFYNSMRGLTLRPDGKEIRKLHMAIQRTIISMYHQCEWDEKKRRETYRTPVKILNKTEVFVCGRKFQKTMEFFYNFLLFLEESIENREIVSIKKNF